MAQGMARKKGRGTHSCCSHGLRSKVCAMAMKKEVWTWSVWWSERSLVLLLFVLALSKLGLRRVLCCRQQGMIKSMTISLGGWRLPEIHGIPCGTAICWVVSVRVFRTLWACKILIFVLHLMAFLRLPKTVPKSPFEAYLTDILRNLQCFEPLTQTSTNRKTLKAHQNNLNLYINEP